MRLTSVAFLLSVRICSAQDDVRYRACFSDREGSKQLEDELLTLLQKYTLGERYPSGGVKKNVIPLHAAFDACGGFDGDGEAFLVPEDTVLVALDEFFESGRTPASAEKLRNALLTAPPPPDDAHVLAAAVVDACWPVVLEEFRSSNVNKPNHDACHLRVLYVAATMKHLAGPDGDPRLQQLRGIQVAAVKRGELTIQEMQKKHAMGIRALGGIVHDEADLLLAELASSQWWNPVGAVAEGI
jgi:hypothetical protein